MVPRPIGEALHAVEPNVLVHCDFLSMPTGYIHVLVDDASGLCQLKWHDRCRADDMVAAMQQWLALFGIIPNWMSDQGPHYKNKVVCRIYGAAHHFAPAHCPWYNGTVEVMMRSIRKTLQAMRVELRIAEDAEDSLIPVVQHALNHTSSPKCNDRAPITAHTQQPPANALSAYRTTEGIAEISFSLLEQWRESHWKELAAARDAPDHDVAAVSTAKRAKERHRRNAQPKARVIQLDVGDYVLVGSVSRRRSKLQIRWLGPHRVVQAIADWVFVVEDLRDSKQSTHHVSNRQAKYPPSA
jgi:hypothetical protein